MQNMLFIQAFGFQTYAFSGKTDVQYVFKCCDSNNKVGKASLHYNHQCGDMQSQENDNINK